jgi:hypothetical protein
MNLKFTNIDHVQPYIQPFVGKFSSIIFEELLNIICCDLDGITKQRLDIKEAQFHIRNRINKLYEITTNGCIINNKLHIRSQSDILYDVQLKKINELIIEDIKNIAGALLIQPEDIKINESHGKILYYCNVDYFNNKTEICDFEWRNYYLIICLDNDSAINSYNDITCLELYCTSRVALMQSQLSKHYINKGTLTTHIFKEYCNPSHFIIFPEEMRSTIRGRLFGNIILELKLQLLMPIINKEQKDNLSLISIMNDCSCLLCKPYEVEVLKNRELLKELINIFPHIIHIIAEYYTDIKIREECIKQNACMCCYCIGML